MRVLLDTNAYTAWRRGHPAVSERVARAQRLLLSAVVVGELLHGFRGGNRFEANRAELQDLLEDPDVSFLPVGLDTADRFGRVMTDLRRQGSPIPTNDVWIAAHAMEVGGELVTFDAHFDHVPGLALTRLPLQMP